MYLRKAITTRKAITIELALVAALAGLAGCSESSAQQAPSQPAPSDRKMTVERQTGTAPGNIRTVVIKVKDVDRAAHKVTFEAKVSPEANISRNGQPIRLDQLNEGDSIRVSFDPRTGDVTKAEVVRKAPAEK